MNVRFDDAWLRALEVGRWIAKGGHDTIALRDVHGRITLLVDDRSQSVSDADRDRYWQKLSERTGKFIGPRGLVLASELLDPASILESPDLVVLEERSSDQGRFAMIEHSIVGVEWSHLREAPQGNRVVFYAFRGGVGRSTAIFMLAQHLALQERSVLVVDLDLESPGVSSLLEDPENLPEYGIVDYIVEAAVGNEAGLDLVCRSRVIEGRGNGEVWVAPASGCPRRGYTYLPKLNRIYANTGQLGSQQGFSFGRRLGEAITACEQKVAELSRKPDFVILDSRSGIHDIPATALTQLSDLCLLFATDTADTWAGYRLLFEQWSRVPQLARAVRERLRMVAAFVPTRSEDTYLLSFRDHAQSCFAETLYDDVPAGEAVNDEVFNPALEDDDAPHAPLPILFTSELVGIDPSRDRGWSREEFVQVAYRRFLDGVGSLLVGDRP